MKKIVALRPKTYSYLIDDDSEHKKAKGTNLDLSLMIIKITY